ncbi:5'-deoxynucleotidase [Sinorhizobium phage phi2LM21]|nr:5'-deoxynucleotidase [Sinorhizobium phage phi2LM21]OWZ95112.1 hypothetical protein B9J07_05820 [Sinorhizobium sp. LM21]
MADHASIERMRESTIRRAIGPTILLGSGTYFDFDDPESSLITLEDVAHGLGYEGRFAGQCVSRVLGCRAMYTVAQHCVLMSYAVAPHLARAALWHEAGEAVCGDMTGPLKSKNPSFKADEKRCEAAILARFGIEITDPVSIKQADIRMLATERRDLLPWRGERWPLDDEALPYDFEIWPWPPNEAAEGWLRRARELEASTNG